MRRAQRWSALAVRSAWSPISKPVPLRAQYPSRLSRSASSVPKFVNREKEAVSVEPPKRSRPNPAHNDQNLHGDQQLIIPDSLAETLRAHRKANQDSVIIRKRNTLSGRYEAGPRTKRDYAAVHVELDRAEHPSSNKRKQFQEYEGKSKGLSLDWEIIGNGIARYMGQPWMRSLDEKGPSRDSSKERLSKEIRAADAFFTPTQKEVAAARRAVNDIESVVRASDGTFHRLDLIGSRASGLATPLSDIDLNCLTSDDPGQAEIQPNVAIKALGVLFKNMRFGKRADEDVIMTSYFAAKARIPIIVGVHSPTGLEFQIQSASSGYGTLETVKCLSAEYPTLTALFKILKQMLKMRGLADGRHGGLTSYPLLIMIAVSLKQNAAQTDPYDVGLHLLQFLDFYSTLDFYNTGITHTPSRHVTTSSANAAAESFYTNEQTALSTIDLVTQDPIGAIPMLFNVKHKLDVVHEPKNDFMMTLHDPANPYNDLGRSAHMIKHIQATFMDIRSKLRKEMSLWDRDIRAGGQSQSRPSSLLHPLIKGDYSMYNLERTRVSAWLDNDKTHASQ